MIAEFGNNYLDHTINGHRIVKKDIVEGLRKRMSEDPERYAREIDAIHLDDAIAITCHPQCYPLFRPGYSDVFPQANRETVRALVNRVVPVRNPLSHANEAALNDALRAISFSTDIVEAIKKQFAMKNKDQDYNAPSVVRVSDSLGRVWHQSGHSNRSMHSVFPPHTVFPGDPITFYVEVDPTFDPHSYKTVWSAGSWSTNAGYMGPQFTYTFKVEDVRHHFAVFCCLVQDEVWHRYGKYDDLVAIPFKVLPMRK